MSCSLDASVGGMASNSYCTIPEADAYWQTRLRPEEWITRADETKCRALLQATRYLDDYVEWTGVSATYQQALAWPRWGMTTVTGNYIPADVLPDQLKWATAELARLLFGDDPETELSQVIQGLTDIQVGPIKLGFEGTPMQQSTVARILAPRVWSLISRWAARQIGGGIEIPLMRV